MIRLRFDLYNTGSGKWKYGGEFELPENVYSWSDDVIQKIADAQKDVVPEAIAKRYYHMVINEVTDPMPSGVFWMCMFPAQENEDD